MTTTDTRYFIAVPADDGVGIFGLGMTEESAVADAWRQANAAPPSVSQGDRGEWTVSDWGGIERFDEEDEAREYADKRGFRASECTERLYRHIVAHGCDAKTFSWSVSATGLDDLRIDKSDLAGALAEVVEGLDGIDNTARADWKVEDALSDAHAYVDAYVGEDEDSEYHHTIDEAAFRTALDLAVRDRILADIAERDAA